jgi:hypothetical protein
MLGRLDIDSRKLLLKGLQYNVHIFLKEASHSGFMSPIVISTIIHLDEIDLVYLFTIVGDYIDIIRVTMVFLFHVHFLNYIMVCWSIIYKNAKWCGCLVYGVMISFFFELMILFIFIVVVVVVVG